MRELMMRIVLLLKTIGKIIVKLCLNFHEPCSGLSHAQVIKEVWLRACLTDRALDGYHLCSTIILLTLYYL